MSTDLSSSAGQITPYQIMKELLVPAKRRVQLLSAMRMAISDDGIWMPRFEGYADEATVAKAKKLLQEAPPVPVLRNDMEIFQEAAHTQATREQVTFVTARSLDTFSSSKIRDFTAFVDGLTLVVEYGDLDDSNEETGDHSVEALSQYAIALAFYRVRQYKDFTPTISEVMKEARKARADFVFAELRCQRLIDISLSAQAVIERENMCHDTFG